MQKKQKVLILMKQIVKIVRKIILVTRKKLQTKSSKVLMLYQFVVKEHCQMIQIMNLKKKVKMLF